VFVFSACRPESLPSIQDSDYPLPEISSISLDCDEQQARWSLELLANAWTGNGELWFSTDGRYIEVHPIVSIEAAADQSSDQLTLSLQVVSDWKQVELGSTTVFNCHSPGLAGRIRLYAVDGNTEADCRRFGEDLWEAWGYRSCDQVIE